jgi:hypothetical protein
MDVSERFVNAINARDYSAASDLMAPDALFTLEGITDAVARMALVQSPMRVVPDEQGTPHLAMKGGGLVSVVARSGAGLKSGVHRFALKLRRDSLRDEWRVWYFGLHE